MHSEFSRPTPLEQRRVRISGYGMNLPGSPLHNDDISSMFGELPSEILSEIGVDSRYWLARPGDDEHYSSTSKMGANAATLALERANVEPDDVDLLVISTSSPDFHLPGVATYVLELVGALKAATIELRAGCTGFPAALDIARSQILAGNAKNALVVGAEAVSPALIGMLESARNSGRAIRLRDKLAAFTFGDGAAALYLESDSTEDDKNEVRYSFVNGTLDASLRPGIRIVGGGTAAPVHRQLASRLLHVELDAKGSERHGPEVLSECLSKLRKSRGETPELFDHIILPEGDAAYFAEQLTDEITGLEVTKFGEKVRQNLRDVGATGSPAVPLALISELEKETVRNGDRVLLLGIEGARYQFSANALTWPYL